MRKPNSKSYAQAKGESQSGIALLTVLALVASMSLAATLSLQATSNYVTYVKSVNAQSQAYWEERSAQSVGYALFDQVMRTTSGSLTDVYLTRQKPITVPTRDGMVTITGFEASNCFNLNALGRDELEAMESQTGNMVSQIETVYLRLLGLMGLDDQTRVSLHDKLADWVDRDTRIRSYGAEDESYAIKEDGHYAANAPLLKREDLRVLEGYETDFVLALRPYVCTYRPDAPFQLNINTLMPEQAILLAAFYSEDLNLETARDIILRRPTGGWQDVAQFKEVEEIALLDPDRVNDTVISTKSHHIGFEIKMDGFMQSSVYQYIYAQDEQQRATLIERRKILQGQAG